MIEIDRYAVVFGEYPSAPGRIYQDPRMAAYRGPERRVQQEPYEGVNRREL